ncbi:MAG: methyltransferase domain-containing protein [Anaerolineae bacterium]|nr:methyltransferase domain-containing protein [Anaerolineae bacterium]
MEELKAATGKVLASYAGYVNTWSIELGLRLGLFEAVRENPGISPSELAKVLNYDPLYTKVWCNATYSGGFLERSDGGFALAPHMDKVLLDPSFPMAAGGTAFTMTAMREHLVSLRERFRTGERTWWDKTSIEFRESVGSASYPFYVRLVKQAFPKMPGVQTALEAGGNVLEMACGTCRGLSLIAKAYPKAKFTVVDGDAETLEMARAQLDIVGVEGVRIVHSALEEVEFKDEFDVVLINVSLHEARDMKKVIENAHRALRPGGWFVVSDFPFPEELEEMRSVPAQVMCGIQYFEALIDDQLLPASHYVSELEAGGFRDIETLTVSPIHAIVYGRK